MKKARKYPIMMLFAIGISNIGDWIYLIALNLIVLNHTGSPLAVAILYILKPLAAIFTNSWAGSLIDRLNKRRLMIFLDLFRAILIASISLFTSIELMYLIVFLINMGSSIFRPAAMTYMTKFIPPENRKRFNSLRSLVDSGGFILGPAIAGMLFVIGTPTFAIYFNAFSLFISGVITFLMPNVEKDSFNTTHVQKLSMHLIKEDWKAVLNFSRNSVYVMIIYFLFNGMIVMTAAVDSLEATFAKEVLLLSGHDYAILVSIAGIGFAIGAFINTIFSERVTTSSLIGLGSCFVSVGYLLYAFSEGYLMAAIGFFVLSFSLAFANTGFHTFYQAHIPVEMMGRIGSVYELVEAVLVIMTAVCIGLLAQFLSIRLVVIGGAIVMLLITVTLLLFNVHPSKRGYYRTVPSQGGKSV
ncbi:MFS transporter [Bacillus sp. FJAT-47783]|uniref:MFS transporter n=1 Tax=Bacillus sp. FJAT-47783 TaxID=2922712 RepID=UPI001FADF8CB|nr:MFS transporter [Bacillus sp. FJAT-47783]